MARKRKPWARLKKVKDLIGGELEKSRGGVPMLIVNIGGGTCLSVAWFGKKQVFRVFEPFPGDDQQRDDFTNAEDVAEHVMGRVKSYVESQVLEALVPFKGMTAEEMRQRNVEAVLAGALKKLHKELGREPTVERVLTDVSDGTMYAQFGQVRGLNGGVDA